MKELKQLKRKNGHFPLKVILFMLLAAILLSVSLLSMGKSVLLVKGEKEGRYYTFSRTVDDFISEAGIELNMEDCLLPAGETELKDGDMIIVRHAIPVTLIVDGHEQKYWTHAHNVNGFLQKNGIMIGDGDHVNPGFTHVLRPDERVEIIRANVEYVRQREPIPYSTLRVNNTALDRGIVKLKQEGAEGEKEKLIAVVEQESGAVSHNVLSEHIIREPVPRIMEYGENTILNRGGRNFEFSQALYVEATAYCPGTPGSGCPLNEQGHAYCTGSYNDGYTFTGTYAVAGDGSLENPHIIAVDPAIIPLHSLLYLEGYGFAHAEDRGGAIKGLTIDLLFDRHEDALLFGRRELKVYLFPN